MELNLTLCDKKLVGDIPTLNYDYSSDKYNQSYEDVCENIDTWFSLKESSKSVFVCFRTYKGLDGDDLREEQDTFMVGHDIDQLKEFIEPQLIYDVLDECIDLAIFEFESYEDAFGYCKDLKEGF